MSSEQFPRLGCTVLTFELVMTAWENLANGTPCLQPYLSVDLEWAKKYYVQMDNTHAYIVAMCMPT